MPTVHTKAQVDSRRMKSRYYEDVGPEKPLERPLKNRHRRTLQAVRHALVRTGRGKHPRPPLHSQQSTQRRILETSPKPKRRSQRLSRSGRLVEDICPTLPCVSATASSNLPRTRS